MKTMILAGALTCLASPAMADSIERACLKSDRKAANRSLCGCIQDIADLTLTQSEQRRAATFFSDPHKTQVVRQSDARRDEMFWKRYKTFGNQAKTYCS